MSRVVTWRPALDMQVPAISDQLQRLVDQGILASRRNGTARTSTTELWIPAFRRFSTKGFGLRGRARWIAERR